MIKSSFSSNIEINFHDKTLLNNNKKQNTAKQNTKKTCVEVVVYDGHTTTQQILGRFTNQPRTICLEKNDLVNKQEKQQNKNTTTQQILWSNLLEYRNKLLTQNITQQQQQNKKQKKRLSGNCCLWQPQHHTTDPRQNLPFLTKQKCCSGKNIWSTNKDNTSCPQKIVGSSFLRQKCSTGFAGQNFHIHLLPLNHQCCWFSNQMLQFNEKWVNKGNDIRSDDGCIVCLWMVIMLFEK